MAIVTFTTDFGYADGYVAAMKGVVLASQPDATLVDVSHAIPERDVAAGAFVLAQAAPHFPPGTVHVAVVDPGVGSARAPLVIECHGAFFVGPDNGLLSLAARGPRVAHRIENAAFMRAQVSPTFHGRDVFAPAAARLLAGHRVAEAGPQVDAIVELPLGAANDAGGVITHIDHFGNLVTSLPPESLPPLRPGREVDVVVRGGTGRFRAHAALTYADVRPGQLLAYVGSGGLVELAVRDGSAALLLGLGRGDDVRLEAQP